MSRSVPLYRSRRLCKGACDGYVKTADRGERDKYGRKKESRRSSSGKNTGIEENFARLEEIIKKLETGESSLEETFAGYEAGMKLVKSLSSQIDKVEKQIQILSEGEDNE